MTISANGQGEARLDKEIDRSNAYLGHLEDLFLFC